jgi:glycosyltransferase involved in cell wall biosynthesis
MMEAWLDGKPDAIVIGGWPFFELAARAPSVGVKSVFIDAGAVPHDGLKGHSLWPQYEVRRARKTFLPYISKVLPISEFICNSQTLPDRGSYNGVRTIHLGADHLRSLSDAEDLVDQEKAVVEKLTDLTQQGGKLVLNLGRFEVSGYKQSPLFFTLLRSLLKKGVKAIGLILAMEHDIVVPKDLENFVICLGKPSDTALRLIMRLAHLGVSMSAWEGFNFPLVEMQAEQKSVLVFSAGAHPEVVAHPIQLCATLNDMQDRALSILQQEPSISAILESALRRFQSKFPWATTIDKWSAEIIDAAAGVGEAIQGRRLLLIDVTNSASDSANSGVVRVTRQVSKRLVQDKRFDVIFVRWNREHTGYESVQRGSSLSAHGGPIDPLVHLASGPGAPYNLDLLIYGRDPESALPPIAFLPEVALDDTISVRMKWLRYRGFVISSILHDLIPVNYPKYCHVDVVRGFAQYIKEMLNVDQCLANSRQTLNDFAEHQKLNDFAEHQNKSVGMSCLQGEAVWLPAQFGSVSRVLSRPPRDTETRILCVSTLEPRKNHKTLLEAVRRAIERRPDLKLRLILVGNKYIGNDEIPALIDAAQKEGVPVEWLGILSEQSLAEEYGKASFTVYPSVVEGFGLPILESLWLGRPCICSDSGVMAELAAGGGCITVNILNVEALAQAIERLASDTAFHAALCDSIRSRALASWDDYASRVGDLLASLGNIDRRYGMVHSNNREMRSPKDYLALLFGNVRN